MLSLSQITRTFNPATFKTSRQSSGRVRAIVRWKSIHVPFWRGARSMMAAGSNKSGSRHEELLQYTACDIADALLALKVPNAGFLPDLRVMAPGKRRDGNVTIAPASTVLMVSKNGGDLSGLPAANISSDKHWVDLTRPETIVVISQPAGQKCAALGGIMAQRISVLQGRGVIVNGRVRDIEELKESGLLVSG